MSRRRSTLLPKYCGGSRIGDTYVSTSGKPRRRAKGNKPVVKAKPPERKSRKSKKSQQNPVRQEPQKEKRAITIPAQHGKEWKEAYSKANTLRSEGRHSEAEPYYKQALELLERLPHPED